MLIMSMDANKAFDRIEPSFLFQTLEAMGFGEKFTQYVRTLFNAPKANILQMTFYLTLSHYPEGAGKAVQAPPCSLQLQLNH